MNEFAALIEALAREPEPDFRARLLARYFRATPDPDRGVALALLRGALALPKLKRTALRALLADRLDARLFDLARDFVGDVAETVALAWPASPRRHNQPPAPGVAAVVQRLAAAGDALAPAVDALMDELDAPARYRLLRLVTSGPRNGVPARDLQAGLLAMGSATREQIAEMWSVVTPPYAPLFALAEGRATAAPAPAAFLAMARARIIATDEVAPLDASVWIAEHAWVGRRAQAVVSAKDAAIYSIDGEDVSAAHPAVRVALSRALSPGVACDGVIVTESEDGANSAVFRAFDLLRDAGVDLRAQPLHARRARLAALIAAADTPFLRLSDALAVTSIAGVDAARQQHCDDTSGVVLKPAAAPYVAGLASGWLHWRREPRRAIAALMYARRDAGRRPPFDRIVTVGVWRDGDLVPVGDAILALDAAASARLSLWVSENTLARYGSTREFPRAPEAGLAVEVAFARVERAPRRKSGVALAGAQLTRVFWEEPAGAATTLERLVAPP